MAGVVNNPSRSRPAEPRRFRLGRIRLRLKLLVISELVLLLLAFALLLPTRSNMRAQIIGDLQNQLMAIASTAALSIDGDLHEYVRETQDPSSPAFLKLRDQLRAIRDVNHLESDYIYTFYFGRDNLLHFGVMPHEGVPFIGDEYDIKPHHLKALQTGQVAVSGLYHDVNGQWISADAPIRDHAGHVVGLLEVTQPSATYFARYDRLLLLNSVIAIIGIAISSLLGYFVLRRLVIQPVRKIHDGMAALGNHDFKHRVEIRTRDEFQQLGETLNGLFDQLNAARSIQAGFFPAQLPESPTYRMAGASLPCDATGGDYYDAFQLDDDRIAVVIADVTGHGLGPSLLMASCRSALQALAHHGIEPGELLQRLERQLEPDLTEGRFITIVLGVLHDDGTFTYANAGHAPALVHRRGLGVDHLPSHRPPLGVIIPLEGEELQTVIRLEPGDRVLLTSDGVNEAQDLDRKQFGFGPIERIVADESLTCDEVVNSLREELQIHRQTDRFDDDVTLLCVDRVSMTMAVVD